MINESSLPSAPAAPPAAPPAATPPSSSAPAPSSAPAAPVAPAQDAGGVAASTTPGAQPHPQSAEALAEQRASAARERLRQLQSGQPDTQTDDGAQPEAPEAQEPAAPIEEPSADAAPPAPIEAGDVDYADLSTPITEEDLRKRYHVPAKLAPELAGRLDAAQKLHEGVTEIGGEIGLRFSRDFNPLLWKQDPTEEDAEAAFDSLVLPNKGGARKLVTKMANHFVTTALYDPDHGAGFASDLIRGEWGVQPDGKTPYDLQFVDGLLKAHKAWGVGPDGKPIDVASLSTLVQSLQKNGLTIDHANKLFRANKLGIIANEYVDAELADHPEEPEHEPSEREKELLAENDRLKAERQTEQTTAEQKLAEQKAEHDQRMGIYRTQAKNWTVDYIMAAVMPDAIKANWAANKGEEVSPAKKTWGKVTSNAIKYEFQYGAGKPQYDALMKMIDDGEAFDRAGEPTLRYLQALTPVRNAARAEHKKLVRELGSELKFAASTSRNAKLVTENGRNGQQPDELQPPPIAQPRPAPEGESYEEGKARIQREYQAKVRAAQAQPGTLR